MLMVSEPQRLTIQEVTVRGVVDYLTRKGFDAHEFSTEYVNRTSALGYPPCITESVHEFMRERNVSVA